VKWRYFANNADSSAYNTIDANRVMAEAKHSESFEEIVEWAYRTLPQEIRELPDFPGIQVADEPPQDVLKRNKWSRGKEMLGVYSGMRRTERLHNRIAIAPDLIFVFRGPIQRCSTGDLRAEVKEVVWHEVAHWLGHSEDEVKELGLATLTLPIGHAAHHPPESKAETTLQQRPPDTLDDADDAEEHQIRCLKCYSSEITCREFDKPMTNGAWLSAPVPVHAKICTCKSCGYEWDDEDNA
jgi:predicted Zn-dependent protease with MMP-like domain